MPKQYLKQKPTMKPTIKPTIKPTMKPTMKPTIKPTMKPTSINKTSNSKDKFNNVETTYTDIIDLISVSPSSGNMNPISFTDKFQDYCILVLKYGFLVVILTVNFLGLSVSLNCNADQDTFKRILSGIFAFFFGFVYLIVNYYTYKVMSQGQICKMDREKLFPFKL